MSLYSSVTFFFHSGNNTILIFNLSADMWALRSQGIIFFAFATNVRVGCSGYAPATSAPGDHVTGGIRSQANKVALLHSDHSSTNSPTRISVISTPRNIGSSVPPIKMWCGCLIGAACFVMKDRMGKAPPGSTGREHSGVEAPPSENGI